MTMVALTLLEDLANGRATMTFLAHDDDSQHFYFHEPSSLNSRIPWVSGAIGCTCITIKVASEDKFVC